MAKSPNRLGTNTEYINTGYFNGKKYEMYLCVNGNPTL